MLDFDQLLDEFTREVSPVLPAKSPKSEASQLAAEFGKTALRGLALGFGIYVAWVAGHAILLSILG